MGRSVETPPGYTQIVYADVSMCEDRWDWQELVLRPLVAELMDRYPSLISPHANRSEWWGHPYRETQIILHNDLCRITLSEYCGCASLAIVPLEVYDDPWHGEDISLRNLAERWTRQVDLQGIAQEAGLDTMYRVGGFSNGTSVYKKVG